MENAFLFETEKINESIFEKLETEKIFYSYFLANQKYYLFIFKKESIDFNFIYRLVNIIDLLDSKKRQIRSIRGLLLYALEIMEKDKEYKILYTNLQPFFWRHVKRIINQNKKKGLQNFLFSDETFENKNSDLTILKQKINYLESKLTNEKIEENDGKFSNLKQIPDQEKKEIIQKGFKLQAKKKITLKEYYEGDLEESLINSKGYRIKFESIRRIKLYKNLKTALGAFEQG